MPQDHENQRLDVSMHVLMSPDLRDRIHTEAQRLELSDSAWLRQAAIEKIARVEQRDANGGSK